MAKIFTIFAKEVRENLRDRRTVMSAVLYGPLFGPIMFAILISFIANQELDRQEKPLEMPIMGAEHAPNLIAFLESQNVAVSEGPEDPAAAVRAQDVDFVVRIPAAFPNQWQAGKPAEIEVFVDNSRQESEGLADRARALLAGYGQQIGRLRLLARGIDPNIASGIAVVERDLSTPQSRGALILAMLPYFVMVSLFMGGMYLAIDSTAGERERQSFEPLLINPVSRNQVMIGKLLATLAFSLVSLALTIVAFAVGMPLIPTEQLNISFEIGLITGALIFLIVVPVGLLAAVLQTIFAALSKSAREAQTYLSILFLVPMVPSFALFVTPVKPELWMMTIPIFSQDLLILQVLRGESVDPFFVTVASAVTILLAIVFGLLSSRIYHRERIAFSSG